MTQSTDTDAKNTENTEPESNSETQNQTDKTVNAEADTKNQETDSETPETSAESEASETVTNPEAETQTEANSENESAADPATEDAGSAEAEAKTETGADVANTAGEAADDKDADQADQKASEEVSKEATAEDSAGDDPEDEIADEFGQTPAGAGVVPGANPARSNMAKQSESMTGSVITQFVIFPAIIVFSIVFAFVFFNWLFSDNRTYPQYMQQINSGWETKAWQSVYELQFRLNDQSDKLIQTADVDLTLRVFEHSKTFKDKRIRASLAVILTRVAEASAQIKLNAKSTMGLTAAQIEEATKTQAIKSRKAIIDALIEALSDPDDNTRMNAMYGLGRLKAKAAYPILELRLKNRNKMDPKTRDSFVKILVFAIGQIAEPRAKEVLGELINYGSTDVRWNTALAMAQIQDRRALPTLKAMLNRTHLEQSFNEKRERATRRTQNVMINAMRGVLMLKAVEVKPTLEKISKNDPDLTVRNFALKVLAEFKKMK